MNIISIYNDFLDRTGQEQNGGVTIAKFNRFKRIADLNMLDWLSGDVAGITPPSPYDNTKVRDWISVFITKHKDVVKNGEFNLPKDYYRNEGPAIIGSYRDIVCGKDEIISNGDTPIEILDSPQFVSRCGTYIDSLKPSIKKPIGRIVGKSIETMPVDLGSVVLYYVRYPNHGEVKVMVDKVYNEELPDPATSVDDEWPEYARNAILYFLIQQYTASTREVALTQQNQAVGKTPRG